jgi:hypothetical protein
MRNLNWISQPAHSRVAAYLLTPIWVLPTDLLKQIELKQSLNYTSKFVPPYILLRLIILPVRNDWAGSVMLASLIQD